MSKILCVFGQHQYGVPARGLGNEYVAFIPALKRLGHEVFHFESWNKSNYQTIAELNRNLLESVIQTKPQVLLAVPFTHELWLETIRLINQLGVSTICWTTDDSWKYVEHSRFMGLAFNCMTTTYPDKLAAYKHDGINNVLLTQWAACQEDLNPPIPSSDCKYDISFVGAAHGSRLKSIQQLSQLGIKVECFGFGWPNGPVKAEEIPRIMRESRISLNFANSKGVNQIKARNFEVPGAGGFLLTEHAPGIENYYIPGQEITVFHNLAELAEQALYYLKNPAIRDRIAQAGFLRTQQQHTYDLRMQEVVDFALKHTSTQLPITPDHARFKFQKYAKRATISLPLQAFKAGILGSCCAIWGQQRGPRAARRITHELSWRLLGAKSYSSKGLTSRLFPHD